jgi:hypothetical protein
LSDVGSHHRAQRVARRNRQVEAAGEDDERHADGHDPSRRPLRQHVEHVLSGQEGGIADTHHRHQEHERQDDAVDADQRRQLVTPRRDWRGHCAHGIHCCHLKARKLVHPCHGGPAFDREYQVEDALDARLLTFERRNLLAARHHQNAVSMLDDLLQIGRN